MLFSQSNILKTNTKQNLEDTYENCGGTRLKMQNSRISRGGFLWLILFKYAYDIWHAQIVDKRHQYRASDNLIKGEGFDFHEHS